MEKIAGFVASTLVTLLAGAFLLGTVGLKRAVHSLPDDLHIRVRQKTIPAFRSLLLPMMLLSVLATGAVAVQYHHWFTWIAFAFTCALPLLTIAINVPVNRRVLAWAPAAPPADWQHQIARWNTADSWRLALSLASALCLQTWVWMCA